MELVSGSIIRFHRLQQSLTLQELADGICSISHLSKIEKGVYEPNKEITELLFKKLGKNPHSEDDNVKKLKKYVNDFYYHWIYSDKEALTELLEKINKRKEIYTTSTLLVHYLIIHLLYNLTINQQDEAKKYLKELETLNIHDFEEYSRFTLAQGIYLRKFESSDRAFRFLKRNYSKISNEDKNEYDYQIGMLYSTQNKPVLALLHLQKAFMQYSYSMNFIKAAACQSIIAFNFGRLNMSEEAEIGFKTTIQSLKYLKHHHLLIETRYNYGLFLKRTNRFSDSLHELKKCEAYFSEGSEQKILLTLAICECLINLKSREEIEEEITRKLSKIALYSKNKRYLLYAELLETKLNNKKLHMKFLEKKYVPYLMQQGSFLEAKKYSLQLLDFYGEYSEKKQTKILKNLYEIEKEIHNEKIF